MKINIIGSTGEIGSKSLSIIYNNFPNFKINLLVANNNYNKLINQLNKYKPKFVCINNHKHIKKIKNSIKNNFTKIILPDDLNNFLKKTRSDLTILSISGYNALNYLENILVNTKNIGIVNKESIVSAGHLFKQIAKKNNVNIYPLDSEHYSLFDFFRSNNKKKYNKIYLTASGGPFFNYSMKKFKSITYEDAINHPKWKMGYKNSIDSATLANKCLEVIEAHYLYNIPFKNIKILVHPEALIHSIVEFKNYTSQLNYFYHDMSIPLINLFEEFNKNNNFKIIKRYNFKKNHVLKFYEIPLSKFPIFKLFTDLNKNSPKNLIKFNCSNEFAVNLFKNKKIKYQDIHKIIKWGLSLNLNFKVNNINNIIKYQKEFMNLLFDKYES